MENQIILQVGVKILLKNTEGKFLLLRRNPLKYPEVGPKWDIVGGRINSGSRLLENLKREIKEETGLSLSATPKLVAAQDILVHRYTDSADNKDKSINNINKHVVRLTYIGEIEGEPIIDGEHTEAKWFTAEEIKNLDSAVLDSYFKELLQNKIINL